MRETKYSAICCYFGQWPTHFQFWLDSCSHNKNITFFLISDISVDRFVVPLNVVILKHSFSDIQGRIRSKFPDLDISINTPYKLCCFKAAYGYIFEDIFEHFDYWGFYDIDTIWGDICSFIPNNENNYLVKIFRCGHLSFIRNDEVNKKPYKLVNKMIDANVIPSTYKGVKINRYEYVFTHPECCYFDEFGGLEPFYKSIGNAYYGIDDFANLYPNRLDFREIKNPSNAHVYKHTKDGKLYHIFRSGIEIKEEEISYLHASKRVINVCISRTADFLVCPNKIISSRELNLLSFMFLSVNWSLQQNIVWIFRNILKVFHRLAQNINRLQ